eukprot:460077-Pyramimonas_sp.AAC.1
MFNNLRVWKSKASAVEGAIDLFEPSAVTTMLPLDIPQCPTMFMIRKLEALGWRPRVADITRTPGDETRAFSM